MGSPNQSQAVECGATIIGPRVGRRVVAWIKKCKNKTTDPSGKCRFHQGRGPYGPGAR